MIPECETYYHGGEHRGYILYKPVNLSENALDINTSICSSRIYI